MELQPVDYVKAFWSCRGFEVEAKQCKCNPNAAEHVCVAAIYPLPLEHIRALGMPHIAGLRPAFKLLLEIEQKVDSTLQETCEKECATAYEQFQETVLKLGIRL